MISSTGVTSSTGMISSTGVISPTGMISSTWVTSCSVGMISTSAVMISSLRGAISSMDGITSSEKVEIFSISELASSVSKSFKSPSPLMLSDLNGKSHSLVLATPFPLKLMIWELAVGLNFKQSLYCIKKRNKLICNIYYICTSVFTFYFYRAKNVRKGERKQNYLIH